MLRILCCNGNFRVVYSRVNAPFEPNGILLPFYDAPVELFEGNFMYSCIYVLAFFVVQHINAKIKPCNIEAQA